MKAHNLITGLLLLTACGGTSLAGPNADGDFILHADPAASYSVGVDFCGQSELYACEAAVARSTAPRPASFT